MLVSPLTGKTTFNAAAPKATQVVAERLAAQAQAANKAPPPVLKLPAQHAATQHTSPQLALHAWAAQRTPLVESIRSRRLCRKALGFAASLAASLEAVVDDVRRTALATCAQATRFWNQYEHALEETPMKAKAFTSCAGLTVADIIAQTMEGGAYDPARTIKLASFGLLWHGISAHVWYQFLDSTVMPENASSSKAIVTKMVLDQTVWAPFNTALFYAYLAVMNGDLAGLPEVLQSKLIPTILAGYALWPAAHIVNFKFVPSNQRLLYINVVNLFWTVYLSRMANSSMVIDSSQADAQMRMGMTIPVSSGPAPSPPDVLHV